MSTKNQNIKAVPAKNRKCVIVKSYTTLVSDMTSYIYYIYI